MNNYLHDLSVVDLLPGSLKVDPFVVALAEAVEIELKQAYREAETLANLHDVDKLPEPLLDYLAYQKHVDFYENTLPIGQKRELIKNSVQWHRRKGTPWTIEHILKALEMKGQVIEWWEYDAEPYHFGIELELSKNIRNLKEIRPLILKYKNVRSWFDGFVVLISNSILLICGCYDYPVYYKTCGEFSGEKNFSQHEIGTVNADNDSYNFAVEYPISEKFVTTIEGESTDITNDTYTYPKRFYAAGELETLTKHTSQQSAISNIQQDCYNYAKIFPVCGDFYAEME